MMDEEEATCGPGAAFFYGDLTRPMASAFEGGKPYPVQPANVMGLSPGQVMSPPVAALDTSTMDLVTATQHGVMERVVHLVEKEGADVTLGDKENITALHWAAINNYTEIAGYLIDRGATIDVIGGIKRSTPLHWACHNGHLPMVVFLMQRGAQPTVTDVDGRTLLHVAAKSGNVRIVGYLVAKGMEPNTTDGAGMTPLMWAAESGNSVDMMRLLLTFGAQINMRDSRVGNTALHWAVTWGKMVSAGFLLRHGADLDLMNAAGETAQQVARRLNNPYMVRTVDTWVARSRPTWSDSEFLQTKMPLLLPFPLFFLIGFIPSLNLPLVSKLLIVAVLSPLYFVVRPIIMKIRDPRMFENLTIGVGMATLFFMYGTYFVIIRPHLNTYEESVILTILTVAVAFNFWQTWQLDPGVIRADKESQRETFVALAESGQLNEIYICTTCVIRRPFRSKHCSVCKACIAKMDHHCPWVGNCIGANNHRYFVNFLFFLTLLAGVALYLCIMYFKNVCRPDFASGIAIGIGQTISCSPWMIWIFINVIIYCTFVPCMLFTQVYQVVGVAMTTNERLNRRRSRYMRYLGVAASPFYRGVLQNLVDFYEIRCCGLLTPSPPVDWFRTYGPGNIVYKERPGNTFKV